MTAETNAWAAKDTSPTGYTKVTELGCYIDNATAAADIDLGIYEDSGGAPGNLVGKITIAKGTSAGWKSGSCDITISAETTYWIAMQVDSSSGCNGNYGSGTQADGAYAVSSLADPWPGSDTTNPGLTVCAYALVSAADDGTNSQINIGDSWKEVAAAKINIGDAWKSVAAIRVNIGDAWKEVFS